MIDEPDLFVRIIYDPRLQFSTGRHPAFEYFHSETENLVADKLTNKAGQVKGARLDVPLGIFLCDAGTALLRARKSFQSYSTDEVVARFLKDNPGIAFVAILTVTDQRASTAGPVYGVKVQLHTSGSDATFAATLRLIMNLFERRLPQPQHTPTNARLRLEEGEPNYKFRYFGGMTMSGRSIRLSARTLLELLAGKMSIDDFNKAYSLDPRTPVNPFLHKLQRGQLITATIFHALPDRDDDEVTVEFGEPDAAVSAFRVPPRKLGK